MAAGPPAVKQGKPRQPAQRSASPTERGRRRRQNAPTSSKSARTHRQNVIRQGEIQRRSLGCVAPTKTPTAVIRPDRRDAAFGHPKKKRDLLPQSSDSGLLHRPLHARQIRSDRTGKYPHAGRWPQTVRPAWATKPRYIRHPQVHRQRRQQPQGNARLIHHHLQPPQKTATPPPDSQDVTHRLPQRQPCIRGATPKQQAKNGTTTIHEGTHRAQAAQIDGFPVSSGHRFGLVLCDRALPTLRVQGLTIGTLRDTALLIARS